MKKQLLFAFGAAALLASCSNDIDSPSENIYDGYLHVKGTINEVKTRATDTSFESGNQIGVSGGLFENVPYSYNGSAFSAVDDEITVTDDNVIFAAYYPYAEDSKISDKEISFDLNSANQNCDFLWASAQASKSSPVANFTFNHKMSQVSFVLVDGTSDNTLQDQTGTITLKNVATTGKFNISTGVVTADEASSSVQIENVSAVTDADSADENTVILPSYTSNSNKIKVTVAINDKTFSGEISPALAAGTKYSYTLTIGDSSMEQSLTISSTGINVWTPAGDKAEDVAMVEDYVLQIGDYLLADGTTKAPNDKDFETFKNNIVGVVYYLGNPQPSVLYADKGYDDKDVLANDYPDCINGLAIAINDADANALLNEDSSNYNFSNWFTNGDSSKTTKYINNFQKTKHSDLLILGYNNTQVYQAATDDLGSETVHIDKILSIIDEYNSDNDVDNASTWYLPSYPEFAEITKNYQKVKTSIVNAGGTLDKFDDLSTNTSDDFYWTSDGRSGDANWVTSLTEGEAEVFLNKRNKKGHVRLGIAF